MEVILILAGYAIALYLAVRLALWCFRFTVGLALILITLIGHAWRGTLRFED